MLNIIWCFFIVVSIIYSLLNGTYIEVNNSVFSSIETTKELVLTLLFNICFWSGIMNIVKNTKMIVIIKRILRPLVKIIFPKIEEESDVFNDISMNIASNLLGLGNAATPTGLIAMEKLKKMNKEKDKLSNEMLLFILINTASIQIIPTTIIGIRMSLRIK